ncbi:GLUG motif-containing protein [Clostridium sp. AM49-4BH]|uniref:GLUG motif-containing protein n=1 Tax=Clostridium sp. AM49-4BH TaxID=2293035 RepID=UPI0015F91CB9|nr:GLUG motif-containing protein [Clostridium sp. AM49-4BH]
MNGYNDGGIITNSYNAGGVSGIERYVGGVNGYNDGGTITNCYNTGSSVSGSGYVGGVNGRNKGTITNCYNTSSVSGKERYVGGVIGRNESNATITNCYYDSTIYTGAAIGNDMGTTEKVEGKTTDEFKTGEVAYLLQLDQSDEVWGQTIGKDTYPTLGGSKVYKNATYKGCEGKPGDAVSYAYSNTKKNTYGDHPDADNDGKCDDCGAIIDGIGAKLAGYSLSLTGNIGVNFYMELSNDIVNDESAYMNFTLPNGTTSKVYVSGTHEDGSTATTDTTVKNGVTYYVFTCEVAAKEMTSDIKAQMIGNNGEKTGKVYTYTVKEYADYILSHTSAEGSNYGSATVQLVKGMLNYGGAAQKYFGYKTDQLASDGLALTEPVFDDTSIINFIKNEANKAVITNHSDPDKVTFKSAYLSLNSTTDLCVSVQFAEDVTVQEDMFAIWLGSTEISKDQYEITKVNEGNCYKITLHGIKASQLQKQYEFEVHLSDAESAVLTYGATSYAYTVMSSACDNINNIESLREVVKALYAYGSCAQGYEYYKNKN